MSGLGRWFDPGHQANHRVEAGRLLVWPRIDRKENGGSNRMKGQTVRAWVGRTVCQSKGLASQCETDGAPWGVGLLREEQKIRGANI